MGSITVNDIREALLDEKIIIKHNGIDIYIECPETKEQLIIPMTHSSVERKSSRVERMFGKKEDWTKRDPDEGQGPYKGFLKCFAAALGGIIGTLVVAAWAAALILAGPALLKLCISYLFF